MCETGNQDICVEQHTEWLTGIQQEVSIVPISNIWDDEVPKWEAYNSASFTRLPNNELEVLLPNNLQESGLTRQNIPVDKNNNYCFDVLGRSVGAQVKVWVSKNSEFGMLLPISDSQFGIASVCFNSGHSTQVTLRIVALNAQMGNKIRIKSCALRKQVRRSVRRSIGRPGQTRVDSLDVSVVPLTHTFIPSGETLCSSHASHTVQSSSSVQSHACRLFDKGSSDSSSEWSSITSDKHAFISYDFASPKKVSEYSLQASNCCPELLAHTPVRWVLEGSANPSDIDAWVLIDNAHNIAPAAPWNLGEERVFYLTRAHHYRAYRIKFIENGFGANHNFHLSQIQFYTRTTECLRTTI